MGYPVRTHYYRTVRSSDTCLQMSSLHSILIIHLFFRAYYPCLVPDTQSYPLTSLLSSLLTLPYLISPHFTSPHLTSPSLSGKPRPVNDEIPFPSLKDEATLAKWKLDRPVSISRNGHNLGPYDDDMPPEVADILKRRLSSCDEFDDEEEDDDEDDEEDDEDDMDDIPEVRRVHVEEGVTIERVKAIGQGMSRGAGAGAVPGLGPGSAKVFSNLEDKAELDKGGDRESGKSFLLSESECSENEIERAMSAVDDSYSSLGRISRGGSKSSILGLGIEPKGADTGDDAEDSLEVEIASSSADDTGQAAKKQSMFTQFFKKLDPSRRKSYKASDP